MYFEEVGQANEATISGVCVDPSSQLPRLRKTANKWVTPPREILVTISFSYHYSWPTMYFQMERMR
jgi:hypothetical protein